jgi:carboxyl-terminal processing protease
MQSRMIPRMNSRRHVAAAVMALLASGMPLGAQQRHISGEAKDYLRRIVEQMRERSLNRDAIDWKQFEAKVLAAADSAQTIADTYPAIRVAIAELGDPQARFQGPNNTPVAAARPNCRGEPMKAVTVPAGVGYIKVEQYRGARQGMEPFAFAGNLQAQLKAGDQNNVNAWIIDVRGLGAGPYFPALTGLGALIGEGVELYLVDNRGNATAQEYEKGKLKAGSQEFAGAVTNYDLTHKQPKVAVLLDGRTGGVGEMIAVALKGRRDARFFGAPSCGLSPSQPFTFKMEDGGQLALSSTIIADRNKKRFLGPLKPDDAVDDPEQVVEHAIAWLTKGN